MELWLSDGVLFDLCCTACELLRHTDAIAAINSGIRNRKITSCRGDTVERTYILILFSLFYHFKCLPGRKLGMRKKL